MTMTEMEAMKQSCRETFRLKDPTLEDAGY
jgi:hypothetical protein